MGKNKRIEIDQNERLLLRSLLHFMLILFFYCCRCDFVSSVKVFCRTEKREREKKRCDAMWICTQSQKEIINNQLIGILIKSIKINYSIIINSRQFCMLYKTLCSVSCAPFPFEICLLCGVCTFSFELGRTIDIKLNWIEWLEFLNWCAIIGISSSWVKKAIHIWFKNIVQL